MSRRPHHARTPHQHKSLSACTHRTTRIHSITHTCRHTPPEPPKAIQIPKRALIVHNKAAACRKNADQKKEDKIIRLSSPSSLVVRVVHLKLLVEECHQIRLQRQAVEIERQVILIITEWLLELDGDLLRTKKDEGRHRDDDERIV